MLLIKVINNSVALQLYCIELFFNVRYLPYRIEYGISLVQSRGNFTANLLNFYSILA